MSKGAIVVLAGTDGREAVGRIANALVTKASWFGSGRRDQRAQDSPSAVSRPRSKPA